MLRTDEQNGLIEELVPHLIPKGLALLQYSDDSILIF
uniref:Uncharacterized protein n=1 Tax=Arundo donax TaxID=35708 RepID=A0A0A9ASD9_ARUDO